MELPQDFKERMKSQLGESYGDFLACFEKERVYGLRYNPLKIEKEKLASLLAAYHISLEPVGWAQEGFYYPSDAQPGKLPLHEAGAYYIQEPSAMRVVELLDPRPGEKVLDLCAAPGGKSTQIAGRLRGRGLLVSNEIVPERAKILSRNMERIGAVNAVVLNETPERLAERFPAFFDRIAVDAPCSGEGMFRKDIEARGEWSSAQVEICAKRQRDILSQAVKMLRPGGILVYSTCTFAPMENEDMINWLLKEYPQFTLEQSEQIWPHLQRGEGHFAARLCMDADRSAAYERISGIDTTAQSYTDAGRSVSKSRIGRSKERIDKKKYSTREMQQAVEEFCRETLSQERYEQIEAQMKAGSLELFGDQLYLKPAGISSLDGLKVQRAGLQMGCCKKNRFEPSHAMAMALHPKEARQVLELEEPERYLRGETVSCPSYQKGWVLVTVSGCSLGWGKAVQGTLKNHYPKGLRRM